MSTLTVQRALRTVLVTKGGSAGQPFLTGLSSRHAEIGWSVFVLQVFTGTLEMLKLMSLQCPNFAKSVLSCLHMLYKILPQQRSLRLVESEEI